MHWWSFLCDIKIYIVPNTVSPICFIILFTLWLVDTFIYVETESIFTIKTFHIIATIFGKVSSHFGDIFIKTFPYCWCNCGLVWVWWNYRCHSLCCSSMASWNLAVLQGTPGGLWVVIWRIWRMIYEIMRCLIILFHVGSSHKDVKMSSHWLCQRLV